MSSFFEVMVDYLVRKKVKKLDDSRYGDRINKLAKIIAIVVRSEKTNDMARFLKNIQSVKMDFLSKVKFEGSIELLQSSNLNIIREQFSKFLFENYDLDESSNLSIVPKILQDYNSDKKAVLKDIIKAVYGLNGYYRPQCELNINDVLNFFGFSSGEEASSFLVRNLQELPKCYCEELKNEMQNVIDAYNDEIAVSAGESNAGSLKNELDVVMKLQFTNDLAGYINFMSKNYSRAVLFSIAHFKNIKLSIFVPENDPNIEPMPHPYGHEIVLHFLPNDNLFKIETKSIYNYLLLELYKHYHPNSPKQSDFTGDKRIFGYSQSHINVIQNKIDDLKQSIVNEDEFFSNDHEGNTPLQYAVMHGNEAMVRAILERMPHSHNDVRVLIWTSRNNKTKRGRAEHGHVALEFRCNGKSCLYISFYPAKISPQIWDIFSPLDVAPVFKYKLEDILHVNNTILPELEFTFLNLNIHDMILSCYKHIQDDLQWSMLGGFSIVDVARIRYFGNTMFFGVPERSRLTAFNCATLALDILNHGSFQTLLTELPATKPIIDPDGMADLLLALTNVNHIESAQFANS